MGSGAPLPVGCMDVRIAAGGGHLEVLRWARAHGCEWDEAHVRAGPAQGGHEEVLRWLDELGE